MSSASPSITTARASRRINGYLMRWWIAVNTAGLAIAVVLSELYSVAHGFRPTPGFGPLYFFLLLAVLGVLHAVAGSVLISFVRMRNKAGRIALGVTVGLLTAILVLILGTTFLWIGAFLAFFVLVPSGILFGFLCASPQPIPSSHAR